jgi:hypothetical protein
MKQANNDDEKQDSVSNGHGNGARSKTELLFLWLHMARKRGEQMGPVLSIGENCNVQNTIATATPRLFRNVILAVSINEAMKL